MRRLNFGEAYRENRRKFLAAAVLPPRQDRIRRRPRTQEEQKALLRLSQAMWNNLVRSGRLEILGPRRYRLNART